MRRSRSRRRGSAATSAMLSGKAMDFFGGRRWTASRSRPMASSRQQMTTSGSDGSYDAADRGRQQAVPLASQDELSDHAQHGDQHRRHAGHAGHLRDDRAGREEPVHRRRQDADRRHGVRRDRADSRTTACRSIGIPLTGIQLLDAQNQPVIAGGTVLLQRAGRARYGAGSAVLGTNGHSRVAILDVPPGTYTLAVTYPAGMGGNQQDNTTVDDRGRWRDDRAVELRQRRRRGSGSGSGSVRARASTDPDVRGRHLSAPAEGAAPAASAARTATPRAARRRCSRTTTRPPPCSRT